MDLSGPTMVDYLEGLVSQAKEDFSPIKKWFWNLKQIEMSNGRIDGVRYKWVINSGAWNNGVFRLYRKPTPTILKVPVTDGMAQGSIFEQLTGAFLGQSLGGPKVLGFGLINGTDLWPLRRKWGLPSGHLFVEMEELFPKQKFFRWRGENGRANMLIENKKNHHTVMYQMVGLYFEAMKKGILVHDPDIAFNNEGVVRWIDANGWKRSRDPVVIENEYIRLFSQIMENSSSDPKLFKECVNSFLSQLKYSDSFHESEKTRFLKDFVDFIQKTYIGEDEMGAWLIRSGLLSPTEFKNKSFLNNFLNLYNGPLIRP